MAKLKNKELELTAIKNYLLPYLNLQKQHPMLPGAQAIPGQAAFIGISEKDLADARKAYSKITKDAALELLKDEAVIDWLNHLPFSASDTILVIGDSHTDDLQGWFDILRQVIEIGTDNSELRFVNSAVYNSTSLDALRRTDRDLAIHKPNWVIIALGSLDSMRLHAASHRTLVSLTEFWENISTIHSMVNEITSNPVIWLCPPPVITELMQDMPLFPGTIHESDLVMYREVLAGKDGIIVDPYGRRLGKPASAWNFLADGFHHSVAGHTATVREVIRTLSDGK